MTKKNEHRRPHLVIKSYKTLFCHKEIYFLPVTHTMRGKEVSGPNLREKKNIYICAALERVRRQNLPEKNHVCATASLHTRIYLFGFHFFFLEFLNVREVNRLPTVMYFRQWCHKLLLTMKLISSNEPFLLSHFDITFHLHYVLTLLLNKLMLSLFF